MARGDRFLAPILLLASLTLALPVVHSVAGSSSVTFRVLTDKTTYLPGQLVNATLEGTNTGTDPVTYTIYSSCGGFGFKIYNPSGTVVFDSLAVPPIACFLVTTKVTIPSGQTMVLSTTSWNQDSSGSQVPAGTYTVTGIFAPNTSSSFTPLANKLIILGTASNTFFFPFILTTTFDNLTISVSGSFQFDAAAKTLMISASVRVINDTSGFTIFSKAFTVSLIAGSSSTLRFVLALSVAPVFLGTSCVVTLGTTPAASCIVTRDPDINHDGTVNIVDIAMIAASYGSVQGSPTYSPAVDLNADGRVNIIDIAIAGADYAAPVFS